ncbi:unnamed protein product [Miscanthus lutarioriparius]|uniref:DUF4371 domain-containing protein n=1 Tax=Miscanthus lutarioriparius TaxID=422564 RepID=A0A811Q4V6_9POAL|nr:unnamed protein product [Miscanthus lutarioriparius]
MTKVLKIVKCYLLIYKRTLQKLVQREVTTVFMDEIRGRKFLVLIDESRDVSIKEQMIVILRFMNDEGKVVERFLGLQHVQSCTAIALKEALVSMLSSHNLSISMLCGQGEISSELLVCMAAFNPRNSFSNFDVDKLVRLAEIYAKDFDMGDLTILPNQLKQFVNRARRTPEFLGCTELGKVAEIMVKTNMHTSYKLVYRLIELTLILPVATASVDKIFLAMSIIKTDLRSKMGDEWLNDLMICYNEKEIFRKIDNEKIKK